MSKWCNTCHRNNLKDIWNSCSGDCPVFGKDFDDLAEMLIKQIEENEALRFANKEIIKVEKEKRRELWEKIRNTEKIYKTVEQECDGCGKHFYVRYCSDGTYEYIGEVCTCLASFRPVNGEPSISEWIEQIKE